MFTLTLVFVVLLASASGQSGLRRYFMGHWALTDEGPQFEELDSQAEDAMLTTETPTPEEDRDVTTEPPATKEPDDGDVDDEFLVWKILLVVLVLLMASVGSLGVIYYLCVWRGGRIHYQPHKIVYT
ncbi:uncharacterized protein ACB058_003997 [Synchiropus picturatus]